MKTSPIKIQRGMSRQMAMWRDTVASRHHRLGWKVGFNMAADQLRLGLPSAMVGFLSSEQCIVSGGCYQAPPQATLLIEPEVAILIGCDLTAGASAEQANAAIISYAAALELVDSSRSVDDDIEEILAGNMFHAGVVIAEQRLSPDEFIREQLSLSLCINGGEVGTLQQQRVPQNFSTIIRDVANILAAQGERLQAGDWIITGAASRAVPVQSGDTISLSMGQLGEAALTLG